MTGSPRWSPGGLLRLARLDVSTLSRPGNGNNQ